MLSIEVPENSCITRSLDSLLKNSSLSGITFTSSKGTINGNVWRDSVMWGAVEKDSVNIYANYNGIASLLRVNITVIPKDLEGPQIALINPAVSDVKVSAKNVTCSFSITDTLSGVGNVVFKTGSTILSDTLHSGNNYQCVVKDLVQGEKTILTIEAFDKSMKKTMTSLNISLTYDPEMVDNVIPKIVMKSPLTTTAVVSTSETSIQVICTDESGIDTVTARKGTTQLNVERSDSLYSVVVSGLTAGKTDTIVFEATDKSSAKNKAPLSVYITYDASSLDTKGPKIALKSPASNNTKVSSSSVTLSVICSDDNKVASATYKTGTLSGNMMAENDSVFTATIVGLVLGENKITITAKDKSPNANSTDSVFTVIYDPTLTDNSGPVITLKSPAVDSTKVSSKTLSVEITCTDTSGVDTITCKIGTTDVLVVKGTGNTYTASVTTLATGANTFLFTATDKASTKQSTTKSVTVIYDPSMIDNVQPKVVIKNPLNSDQRVLTDTITVQIDCSDDSRISSVTATRGGAPVTGITNAGSLYSVMVTELRAGKSDTINFKVVDSSSNKNAKDFPVILRYNRLPAAATLSLPADGATGIIKTGVFTWINGDDPDGDAVTYTLRYGTSGTALSSTISNLTAKTFTLTTGLNEATKYYWQVVTHTKANDDSAVSGIASFTTVEDKPSISVHPVNQSPVVGSKATFSCTASGLNLKYQWQKGTTAITGATASTYQTEAVVSADDGSTYSCIVSNGGGSATSTAATLTVVYGVTYNVNTGSGTPVSDPDHYAKGKSVTVLAGTGLSLTGYAFAGWCRTQVSTGVKIYAAGDTLLMGAANLVLYAVWSELFTVSYSGNDQLSGTAPSGGNYTQGAQVTVAGNTGVLAKTGFEFTGWNTAAKGTGTDYTAGQKITIGTSDLILYAKWSQTYGITYNANSGGTAGGHGNGTVPIDNKKYVQGGTVTVLENSGGMTKVGYVFDGWNTSSDGSGTTFTAGTGTFKMGSADVILYAKWVIKDASGNVYTEVTIDGKVWMVQNLRTTKLNNGTDIVVSNTHEKFPRYNPGDLIRGHTYNGYAVYTGLLAPTGWHAATPDDWYALKENYGTNAKAIASKEYWKVSELVGAVGYNNGLTNNSTGFTAVPGADGEGASFWCNGFDEIDNYLLGGICSLYYDSQDITISPKYDAVYYNSIRCVRDY